ncbi:hypothetical protein BCR34DRAFT_128239 [Clohesyomyces aquaticus]|uniref:Secreted protein n=1 Tax=Clohesyomyces aquaticus TaxID=1231657 RepID=A0A1Y2AAV4_9PLEO|nr:hypothetical protein BCR34DRAFT_128239 [Clohesyomyces aquaticus]
MCRYCLLSCIVVRYAPPPPWRLVALLSLLAGVDGAFCFDPSGASPVVYGVYLRAVAAVARFGPLRNYAISIFYSCAHYLLRLVPRLLKYNPSSMAEKIICNMFPTKFLTILTLFPSASTSVSALWAGDRQASY